MWPGEAKAGRWRLGLLLLRLGLDVTLTGRTGLARLRADAVAVEIVTAQRIHDLRRHALRSDDRHGGSEGRQTRVMSGAVTDRQADFAHR